MNATSLIASSDSSSGLSLAVRLHAGSSEAWSELVELYGPLIESWCRRFGIAEATRMSVRQAKSRVLRRLRKRLRDA